MGQAKAVAKVWRELINRLLSKGKKGKRHVEKPQGSHKAPANKNVPKLHARKASHLADKKKAPASKRYTGLTFPKAASRSRTKAAAKHNANSRMHQPMEPASVKRESVAILQTPIDSLLEILSKEKEMKIQEAASRFKVSEETIENWGRILEEHKLAELHYPVFGKPVLRALLPEKAGGRKAGPEEREGK